MKNLKEMKDLKFTNIQGTWSASDMEVIDGNVYYLVKNLDYSNAPKMIIDEDSNIIIQFVKAEFNDLYEQLDKKKASSKLENVILEGMPGTWYKIDSTILNGKEYFLFESENWGDEIPCIITDNELNIILMNTYNGFSDLEEHLQ